MSNADLVRSIQNLSPDKRAELRQRLWERGQPTTLLDEPDADAPASFTQRRLVFLQELARDSSGYHSPLHLRLGGRLDVGALTAALGDVVGRHAVLLAGLPVRDGKVLQIAGRARPGAAVVDLTALPAPEREAAAESLAAAHQSTPFDLAAGPLVRYDVVRLADLDHVLLLTFHHAAFDGWSIDVFIRDLAEAYQERVAGHEPARPAPAVTFAEYSRWQADWVASAEAERQLAYWEGQLAGSTELLPLPLDRPRPARPSHHGGSHHFVLGRELNDGIRAAANRSDATLFMILLAAFQVVLSRYSATPDVTVGTPIANRRHRQVHDLVGFFANSLALRSTVAPEIPFAAFLREVRDICLAAYDHQDIPLDLIAQRLQPNRDLSHNPLYQVNLTLHNTPRPPDPLPGLTVARFGPDLEAARFDLDLNIEETADGLACQLVFATDLFLPETAARISDSLRTVLAAIVADDSTAVGDLPLSTPAELRRYAGLLHGEVVRRPADLRLHRLVAERAAADPEATAMVDRHGERVSAGTLDRAAGAVAAALHTRGIGRGDIVAVCLPRTPWLVTVLLGVLRAGAAYLPLDPAYPESRLELMLDDSGAALLVCEGDQIGGTDRAHPADLIESGAEAVVGADTGSDGDIAYLIYTSGSTGAPKAAVLSHASVANYVLWAVREFALDSGAGVPLHSSVSFDLTVTSIFGPLLGGSPILFLDESGLPGEAVHLSAELHRDLAMVKLTPSHLRLVEDVGAQYHKRQWARALVIGGEDLRADQVEVWREAVVPPRLFNEFGPTETAVACACHEDDGSVSPSGRIPIGRPIANVELYVLDSSLTPVPPGVPGELYVGGAAVSYGYWRRPWETALRFVPDPFGTVLGGRLYRTGDQVRLLAGGNLEYLGRLDDQVKVRGHRIELGEITEALGRHPGVQQARAILAETPAGPEIVGVLHASPGVAPDEKESPQDQVAEWRMLYNDLYSAAAPTGGQIGFVGWGDSYTGGSIAVPEMHEWLDRTVERINGLHPRRVLEIGCGNGLILSRVAPSTTHYRGTDLSPAAIDLLQRSSAGADRQLLEPGRVDLAAAPAHESVRPGDTYDTVILNSVVQYFPSAGYLHDVLAAAVGAVTAGGHVFIGDVRHLGLLELFHLGVQAARCPSDTTVAGLRSAVRRAVDRERELCLDPRFFLGLQEAIPRISSVSVRLKRGLSRNELTDFRYDVVLSVESGPATPVLWRDWAECGGEIGGLAAVLSGERPSSLAVRGIPNARLTQALQLRRRVAAGRPGAAVGALLGGDHRPDTAAVDPEDLPELAEVHGYRVDTSWAASRPDGAFDVVFSRGDAVPVATPQVAPAAPGVALANDPLWPSRASALAASVGESLRERLPEAMVPAHYLVLREFPLTPNGKLDQLELQNLVRLRVEETSSDQQEHAAVPLTVTEERIAEIWRTLLDRDTVRAEDDFFDLGGHSLLTFKLVSRLRAEFEVNVPVRAPFEAATLAEQGRLIEELTRQTAGPRIPELVPQPRPAFLPTSFAQERLWFVNRLQPESIQYNYPFYARMQGKLDVTVLRRAIAAVVERHEIMRTVIRSDQGRPYQEIMPLAPVPLPVIDLSGLPEADREETAAQLARLHHRQPIDLGEPPLVRITLLRLAGDEHILLIATHHVVIDGWSNGILMREITEHYTAFADGRAAEVPDLPVQYADYAIWQRQLRDDGLFDHMRSYWADRLAGVHNLPQLPLDRPHAQTTGSRGRRMEFEMPDALLRQVSGLCRKEDCTLFMALLAAMHTLLARRTGQSEVAVGSDVAGRSDPATEDLIGFFVNQVVLRGSVTAGLTWRELLRKTKELVVESYANQELPFEDVVRAVNPPRTRNPSPLFQTKMTLNNTARIEVSLPGLTVTPYTLGLIDTSRLDLMLMFTGADDTAVAGTWEYNPDVFEASTVAAMHTEYLALLEQIVAAPEGPVAVDAAREPEEQA